MELPQRPLPTIYCAFPSSASNACLHGRYYLVTDGVVLYVWLKFVNSPFVMSMTVATHFPSITSAGNNVYGVAAENLVSSISLQIMIVCTSSLLHPCPPNGNISHFPCHDHRAWQRQNSGSWQSPPPPHLRLRPSPTPNGPQFSTRYIALLLSHAESLCPDAT